MFFFLFTFPTTLCSQMCTHTWHPCIKPGLRCLSSLIVFLALWLQIWAAEQVRCLFSSYCTEQYVRQRHPGRTGVSKSSCLIVFEEQRKSPLMFIWNNPRSLDLRKFQVGLCDQLWQWCWQKKNSSHTEMMSTSVSRDVGELLGAL